MLKTISRISLLLSVILFASSSFAQSIKKSEHFRHLMFRETPYSPYKGIYPISKAEAKKIAHYRFDYDQYDRVVAISHQLGDKLIGDNGNWDTFVTD